MRKHTKLEEKKHYVIKVKKNQDKKYKKSKIRAKKLSDRQDFETHVAVSQ